MEKIKTYTGSLVEASLKTQKPRLKLKAGKKYSVQQLLAGNGITRKKFSLKQFIV